jgi:ergot alkaloid biosynthesis protein
MRKPILILGGNGKTGSRLAAKLNAKKIPYVTGTRKPTSATDRKFDWEDARTFAPAFDSVGQIYIVAPTNRADHEAIVPPALEIAKAQGVERFVLLSAASIEKGGPMMGAVHQWLEENTSDWAVLRPSWFMQNMLEPRHLTSIADEQRIYSATGDGKLGFIDADDIAEVALAAFESGTAWNFDEILTGGALLSYSDLADELSKHLGRQISHINLSVAALAERLMDHGLSRDYAELLAGMDGAIAKGASEALSDAVIRRTGKAPTSFAAMLMRDGAALIDR